jgi:hypothetical protein
MLGHECSKTMFEDQCDQSLDILLLNILSLDILSLDNTAQNNTILIKQNLFFLRQIRCRASMSTYKFCDCRSVDKKLPNLVYFYRFGMFGPSKI